MSAQRAYERLEFLTGTTRCDTAIQEAWGALKAAIEAGGALPLKWDRLTATQAAERVGRTQKHWASLVNQHYAPPADGVDSIGRKYWLASTVDRYARSGYRYGWPDER